MFKKLAVFLILIFTVSCAFATHERAGEITYKHIEGLTYEITITTYTYSPSPADRPELEIKWGDGTSSIIGRASKTEITPIIRKNIYIGTHTYSGSSTFLLTVEDPNRNYGVINIPNSVNIPFFIQTQLFINPFLGPNNSVILQNPPIDIGCVNKLFVHNPGAYDPDGDSISYKLTICRGANGLPIPGYTLPQASVSFSINETTGDLIWDSPVLQGEYNVAFIVEEWRNGGKIGYVTREMQIQIDACNNDPPIINSITDTCVEAGQTVTIDIVTEDPNGDNIIFSASGSPFSVPESPAQIVPSNSTPQPSPLNNLFVWETKCSHIRKNPHTASLKAVDDGNPNLTAYSSINITVVGPAPENLTATPLGISINLDWDQSICTNAVGYKVYRKSGFYGFVPGPCETGVPAYTGYSFIKEINGISISEFSDDNNGNGLIHGIEYCYMVTAVFADGAEGYASEEACATLKKDMPIITNVSVTTTDISNGSIYFAWSKPTELDFSQTPGPFEYQVFRKDNSAGSEFEKIITYVSLNDTTYNDFGLNTLELQYQYRIDFYNSDPNNYFLIGSTIHVPSVFLNIEASDQTLLLSWNNNVPWTNNTFVIYRQDPVSLNFDSIGWSPTPSYADTNLINGKEYCYLVKCKGSYFSGGLIDPIINFSQENCGRPIDNVPPCPPVLSLETNCEMLNNDLTWFYPDTCAVEDLKFYIYYASSENSDYQLIDSTVNDFYVFQTNPPSVVGCFAITALDSLWNESVFSNHICVDIDECGRIWFPRVITPNGDGFNDFYFADSVNSVIKLDLTIFNRWGTVVYETEDPFFKWDGTDQTNNKECSPGTYFFEATVSEASLRGLTERKVRGSITLLR
jgi:gliding motility-associated-like protein